MEDKKRERQRHAMADLETPRILMVHGSVLGVQYLVAIVLLLLVPVALVLEDQVRGMLLGSPVLDKTL